MRAIQFKCLAMACIIALGFAHQSYAVDAAEAASVMADLQTLAIEAKENLAKAALEGVITVEEAMKQSEAIDAAVEAGKQAQLAMEEAIENKDDDAAEAAEDDLAAALSQAKAVMAGVLTAAVGTTEGEQTDDGEQPDDEGAPPNIYDQPWKTDGIRAYYESLFGAFQDASAFGDEQAFGNQNTTPDLEATPE